MPTTIDWNDLTTRTAGYAVQQCAPEQEDTVFANLYLKTSDINSRIAAALGSPTALVKYLNIFVDTLVVDAELLPSAHITVVARHVVLSGGSSCIRSAAPDADTGVATVQVLTAGASGGTLAVAAGSAGAYTPALLAAGPMSITCVAGGDSQQTVAGDAGSALDMLRNPLAWNALKASFQAATLLVLNPGVGFAEGIAMLRWLAACSALVATEPSALQDEAADLSYQAAALLVLLGTGGAAPYVPTLSADFYQDRMVGLLNVVASCEQKIEALQTTVELDKAVEQVSGTLAAIGLSEKQAITVALDNNTAAAQQLVTQYTTLLDQYNHQFEYVKLRQLIFEHALQEKQIWDTAKMVLDLVMAVGTMVAGVAALAVAPEAAPEAAKATEAAASGAAKGASETLAAAKQVQAVTQEVSKLRDALSGIKDLQENIAKVIEGGVGLWTAARALKEAGDNPAGPTIALPDLAAVGTADPVADWNIFMLNVKTGLEPLKDVDGYADYLTGLLTLAEYGKSLNNKAIALAQLQSRCLELQAQVRTAALAQQRWTALSAAASTDIQRRAVLQAILLQHLNNAKRSLLVEAKGYAAAYRYHWLVEPLLTVTLDMNAAQLSEQFAHIKQGIEGLLSLAPPEQSFDTGYFTLPVVQLPAAGSAPQLLTSDVARVLMSTSANKTTLTWSIPLSAPPFADTVPGDENIALFVTEGWFRLEGATPNQAGMVKMLVYTSGAYANCYGPNATPAHFVSPQFRMNFIYAAASQDTVLPNTPWKPANPNDYLKPTPFDVWTAEIDTPGGALNMANVTALRMRLTGIYHQIAK